MKWCDQVRVNYNNKNQTFQSRNENNGNIYISHCHTLQLFFYLNMGPNWAQAIPRPDINPKCNIEGAITQSTFWEYANTNSVMTFISSLEETAMGYEDIRATFLELLSSTSVICCSYLQYLILKDGRSKFPYTDNTPDSKVRGANMGPTWGRKDPGGPHVGHMNIAIWDHYLVHARSLNVLKNNKKHFNCVLNRQWCITERIHLICRIIMNTSQKWSYLYVWINWYTGYRMNDIDFARNGVGLQVQLWNKHYMIYHSIAQYVMK